MEFREWIRCNLSKPDYFARLIPDWDLLFGSILWSLWLYRNSVVFECPLKIQGSVLDCSKRMQSTMLSAFTHATMSNVATDQVPRSLSTCSPPDQDASRLILMAQGRWTMIWQRAGVDS
ncbi:hypothetical protein V6N12_045429 [Hibiscus sabdariffa]|uniref:Uncharacterized protein n=1 Tax=Hibiscus sabdariffa TaxID=183260 RepID=A0ABR2G2Q5_9ROSI